MNHLSKYFAFLFFLFFVSEFFAQATHFKKDIQINGRIQYDYEFLKRENSTGWFNGSEFRRVYLSFNGHISKHISYKVEVNFAQAEIHFNDMYVKYNAGKYGVFGIGSITEPNGLNIATSSKYISFFERSMLTNLQNGRWGTGLHYENFNLLDGNLGLQLALTNNGKDADGFKDTHLEKGQNFVSRISFVPLRKTEEHALIHLGLNYANRPAKILTLRAENHMGQKYTYDFTGGKKRQVYGFELATTYHAISLQSEYKMMVVSNSLDLDYNMTSYYAFVSYFITGEYRPYKYGAFGRVKPKKDIENGGYGAFEILARFSNLTASHDVINANPLSPKEINNISFGLNWYLTSHARIMYNYIFTDDQNKAWGNLSGHLIRMQIDF